MWAGPLVCVAADGTVLHHPVLTGKAQFGSAASCLFSPDQPSSLLICTESCRHREPSAHSGSSVKRCCWWENKCLSLTKLLTASSWPKLFYCFTLLQMEQQNKEMMDFFLGGFFARLETRNPGMGKGIFHSMEPSTLGLFSISTWMCVNLCSLSCSAAAGWTAVNLWLSVTCFWCTFTFMSV